MQVRLLFAIALSALLSAVSTVSAAPIQGIVNPWTGSVVIKGFTGEIFGALRGPENSLLPANALANPPYTLDATLPGEIAYLGLGGINGQLNVGNVVKPGLPLADLLQLKIAYQVSFTSEIVEVPLIPEPGSFSLLVVSVAAVMAANRRRSGRQRCLAVPSRCRRSRSPVTPIIRFWRPPMRIAGALAALLLTLTSAASAAPIQGVIDAKTGFAYASGLTGEIFLSLKVPTAFAVLPPPTGIEPWPLYHSLNSVSSGWEASTVPMNLAML